MGSSSTPKSDDHPVVCLGPPATTARLPSGERLESAGQGPLHPGGLDRARRLLAGTRLTAHALSRALMELRCKPSQVLQILATCGALRLCDAQLRVSMVVFFPHYVSLSATLGPWKPDGLNGQTGTDDVLSQVLAHSTPEFQTVLCVNALFLHGWLMNYKRPLRLDCTFFQKQHAKINGRVASASGAWHSHVDRGVSGRLRWESPAQQRRQKAAAAEAAAQRQRQDRRV